MVKKILPKGVTDLEDGRYLIRAQFIDPKTGRRKDIIKTVEASSPEEAAYLRVKLRGDWLADRTHTPPSRPRFGESINAWLERKTLKASTRAQYTTSVRRWNDIFGDYWLDAVSPIDVEEVMQGWREAGLDPHTINGRLRVLRTFARQTRIESMVTAVSILPHDVREEEENEDNGRGLSLDELRAWLTALDLVWFSQRQWRPMLRLMAWTGLRFGEASSIEWDDVDLDACTIRIRRAVWRGKIDKVKARASKRLITIPEDVAEELKDLDHKRPLVFHSDKSESGYLSNTGLRKNMLLVCAQAARPHAALTTRKRSDIDTAGARWLDGRPAIHCLRHTVNNLLRNAAPEIVRQAMIGHADEKMNATYSKVDVSEKRAAMAAVVSLVKATK